MQPMAAWLVARPQNAVLGLAATLLLPILQIVSGIIMVLLVLRQGPRLAVIEGAIAAALLMVIAAFVGAPVMQIVIAVLSVWLPAVLIAVLLQWTRSIALTLQVSALLAGAAVLAFYALVDDKVAYWQPVISVLLEWARGRAGGAEDVGKKPPARGQTSAR